MTAEQTVTFIKLLNHHEILSFSGEDSVMLDLGAGAEVRIRTDGSQSWYLNGQLHRNNDPAEIWADGTQRWWLNGQLHRTDGPAEILSDRAQILSVHGQLNRTAGPAVIFAKGPQRWRLNGEEVIQEEHARRTGQ